MNSFQRYKSITLNFEFVEIIYILKMPAALKKIQEFFNLSNGTAKCLVIDCKSNLKTTKQSHLYRHIKQVHPSKLAEIYPEKEGNLEYLREETIWICVEHVAVCGRPILSLSDSSMQKLLKPRFDTLHDSSFKLSFCEVKKKLATWVHDISNEIRSHIRNEINGNYYSVMFDSVTKMRRAILGVNIQYIKDGQIKERSIAMQKFTCRHTAENISNMVIHLLQNVYGLSLTDLVAATVDNANNMTAAVRKIDKIVSSLKSNDSGENESGVDEDEDEDEDDDDDEDDDSVEKLWLEPEYQKHLLESVATNLSSKYKPILHESVETINCGGHTAQLCVEEALEKSNCGPIVTKARNIVKQLHCQSLVLLLEASKLPIPPMDNTTRWFSTYLMVCAPSHHDENYISNRIV